jgi:hypothetical protein
MLTEYEGMVFNVEIRGAEADIWKYIPVDGFKKVTIPGGVTYYEKTVRIKDIGELFSVSFVAFVDGRRFIIDSVNNNNVNVLCDDREYAEKHNYSEIEHGVWISAKPMDMFDKFQMEKLFEDSTEMVVLTMNKNQMVDAWNKYVREVEI